MIRGKELYMATTFGLVACGALVVSPATAQETVCQGIEESQVIHRFDSHPISSEAAATADDLRRLFQQYRADIEAVMRSQGQSHLVEELFAAVESGRGVSERNLVRGETFAWMASRKEGVAVASGPGCLAATQIYEAFEIRITEESTESAQAQCVLNVSSDCEAATLRVDATGSSDGVRVGMTAAGATTGLLSGGSKTWSGDFADRFTTDYSFTASAQATGKKTVTTHTFVVPKVCLNLAYVGKPTTVVEELSDSCSETAEVQRCTAPSAGCSIELEPPLVRTGKDIRVGVTGHWDAANPAGVVVPVTGPTGDRVLELSSFPATVSFPRPGTYTFNGTATNEAGETESCSSEIVVDPLWTFRAFPLRVDPADDSIRQSAILPNGVYESSSFTLGGGSGLGAEVEYHFGPRIGLQGSLLLAYADSLFKFDRDNLWEMDSSDIEFGSLTVGPTFHLTPGRRANLYLGPFVGLTHLGDGDYRVLGETVVVEFGIEFTFGALLGVDVPLGAARIWALHFGARYADLSGDGQGIDFDVDPFLFEAGLSRYF